MAGSSGAWQTDTVGSTHARHSALMVHYGLMGFPWPRADSWAAHEQVDFNYTRGSTNLAAASRAALHGAPVDAAVCRLCWPPMGIPVGSARF